MATQRYISTSFWTDKWIRTLDPSERYLYMYLLTNPQTNIAGIYQITMDRIAFDTGYDERTLRPMLERFAKAGKAYFYDDEYIILPSWPKHQRADKKATIKKGIDSALESLPDVVKKYALGIGYTYPIHTLPIGYGYGVSYSDLDSDSDLDTDTDTEAQKTPPAPETPKTEPRPEPVVAKYDDTKGPHFACVGRWFRAMATATGIPILPDERDILAGRELLASLGGDAGTFDRLTDYYFANWRGIWWARDKTTGKPDFSFRSFKAHSTELVGKISEPKRNEPKSWSTASAPVADEEIITPEQMAAVKSKLRGKGLPLMVVGGQA